ncbi:MAG: tetratricopeptide repeat protein [Moorea sp. SIO2I5]|nr:tetratricopeptide repeat protein [Moorena sp. SIO2I5]
MLEELLSLLQEKQSQEGDSGTDVVLELNWDSLQSSAQTMAALMSLFALAPIPWSLVSKAARAARLDFDLVVNRDILVQKYLLQKLDDNTYQLHERIRDFLTIKGEQLADIEKLKQGFCSAIVAIAKDIPETPTQVDILVITPAIPHLVEVATNQKDYLNDQDLIWPFVGLGRFYYGQGAYEQALPWYQQCLLTVRERLGENHPAVATSLNNLGLLYNSQGRYQEAETLYQQALEMRRRLLGKDHPDVAESLNNLAGLYSSQGRYQEAEPLYLQALEMRKRLLGEEHPDVAQSFNNLALLYWSQGRYSEAEPLYLQALEMKQRLLSQQHPHVANTLNNLALLYESQGRYQEAETLYLQELEMTQRLLGQDHPSVATSLNNLAGLYESQGREQEAETLYLQALEMTQRLLGQDHPSVATSLNNLAGLYESQRREQEAETLYLQALELRKPLRASKLNKSIPFIIQEENKFPDCLMMELKVEPVSTGIFQPRNIEKLKLYLTIQFNEQWLQMSFGRVRFGPKSGELRLKLKNGNIPLAARNFSGSFDPDVEKERRQQESKENHSKMEASWDKNKPGVKANHGQKNTGGTTDGFQFIDPEITTKGSEETPAWVFHVKTGQPVFKGLLKEVELGTIDVIAKPCYIEATFEVYMTDVHLTGSEGLWSPEISREERVVLDRKIALLIIKKQLKPYLSKVVLKYE